MTSTEIDTGRDGKHFILRTPVSGDVGPGAAGVALPPNIREATATAQGE